MNHRLEAPGLTADWLNGWLAAIGATVLVPGLRLGWANEAVPFAVYESDDPSDIVGAIAQALSTAESLSRSTIAPTRHDGHHSFVRRVTLDAYRERAALERREGSGHVAASASDLRVDAALDNLDHGAFDPAAPGTTGSLWERAQACQQKLPTNQRESLVHASLFGLGHRMKVNGLGFDARRLATGVHSGSLAEKYADPVVELMVFAALVLFPTRGDGRKVRQRGWRDRSTQRGAFGWSAWRPFLDRWAIDAFLDLDLRLDDDLVLARYQVVPYQPSARADKTRAYFAERIP